MPEIIELEVGTDYAGQRVDRYLSGVLPSYSRARIQRLIRDGHITVAGHAIKPSAVVHDGDRIVLDLPPLAPGTPLPEELPLEIVYQDIDIVVVNKPAGMVVHPAAGHAEGTLVNALLHHIHDLSGVGGERRPGIVHRLDRGTSGLMVVAKNDEAHVSLARQFHDREIEKRYVTLVWGAVLAGKRIDAPIGRDPNQRHKMSTRARRARTAVTRVTASQQFKGLSLLEVALATGRTHQIRVHLNSIGHPIVGDPTYGGVHRHMPGDLRALAKLERPFLHAARLAFTHPRDGRRVEFTSPLAPDLQEILDAVRPVT